MAEALGGPLVWIVYALLGIGLPAVLYIKGYWGGTFVLGAVATIAMAVNLIYPLRQPYELASARVPLREV